MKLGKTTVQFRDNLRKSTRPEDHKFWACYHKGTYIGTFSYKVLAELANAGTFKNLIAYARKTRITKGNNSTGKYIVVLIYNYDFCNPLIKAHRVKSFYYAKKIAAIHVLHRHDADIMDSQTGELYVSKHNYDTLNGYMKRYADKWHYNMEAMLKGIQEYRGDENHENGRKMSQKLNFLVGF